MFFNFGQPCFRLNLFLVFILFPFVIHSQHLSPVEIENELKAIRMKRGMDSVSDKDFEKILDCVHKETCSSHHLIVNEIIIRKLALAHEVRCYCSWSDNPNHACFKIFRPPSNIDDSDPSVKPYEIWQHDIVDFITSTSNSNIKICDPFKNLYCKLSQPPTDYICECLPGSVWNPSLNTCVLKIGMSCSFNTNIYGNVYPDQTPLPPDSLIEPFYYDPLSPIILIQHFEKIIQPNCVPISPGDPSCKKFSYLGKPEPICFDPTIEKLDKYFDGVINEDYGNKCNFEDHQSFYTISNNENNDTTIRLKGLNTLMAKGNKFCNLKKFLTCSLLNICECMLQAVYDDKEKKCILPPPYDSCGKDKDSMLKNMSIIEEGRMSIGEAFADQMNKSCIEDHQMCYFDSSDANNMQIYCSCPIGKTGKKCDESLTKFINHVRPAVFAHDASNDDEKNLLYDELNNAALDFEKMFNINENDPCNPKQDIETERTVRLIRRLDNSNTVNVPKIYYTNLTSEIKYLTTFYKNNYTCNHVEIKDIKCNPTKKQCYHASYNEYTGDLFKQLEVYQVMKCGENCDPDINKYKGEEYDKWMDNLTTIWLTGKTKFCNKKEKGHCGNTGKCECNSNPGTPGPLVLCKGVSIANNSFQIILILAMIVFFD